MMLSTAGFSFTNDAISLTNLQLRLQTNLGEAVVTYDQASGGEATATVLKHLKVDTTVTPADVANAAIVVHTLTNTSSVPIWIRDVATGQFSPESSVMFKGTNGLGWDLRFAHTDNVRIERYPHCLMEYPYLRMLPTIDTQLGIGEDQAFPGLYICDERKKHGLIIAAASQDLSYLTFTIRKQAIFKTGAFDTFEIRHDFRQSGGLHLHPGQTVALDGIYVQLVGDLSLNDIYADYIDFIATRHTFRGPTTTLLTSGMHCTWNYGVFADQNEAGLLKTARFIAENFPGIRYFLMDAGYLHGDIATTFLDRFYPDPEQYVVPEKWPDGIRGYTDKLRALGLKPGIWWSPTLHIDGQIYQDHPEWFLRRKDGGVYLIGEKNAYLDYTHPEAINYLDRTLAHILGKWGFEACKMDFWSQNFESPEVRLHDPTQTIVQVRTRFFETVRKNLPPDGPFMTCVAVGMGNPFIGQHADTYRNTIDIGVGHWHEQKYNCAWALPTLTLPGAKTFLLNNDSVGANLDAPEHENFFRFTWSFINQGLIETGGRMETWPDVYVDAMRRCTTHIDRGHPVRCADLQAFTGEPFPKVLYIDYPADSATAKRGVKKHIALFNWDDEPQIIGAANDQLGLQSETCVRDFWTDEQKTFGADGIYEVLPPRTARLYEA